MCRRIRMAALLGAVALLAGCTDQPAGRPAEETPGRRGRCLRPVFRR
ncbi:hypothetical protein ACFQ0O_00550 [Saccharopolyspora spinosporotrichia]